MSNGVIAKVATTAAYQDVTTFTGLHTVCINLCNRTPGTPTKFDIALKVGAGVPAAADMIACELLVGDTPVMLERMPVSLNERLIIRDSAGTGTVRVAGYEEA